MASQINQKHFSDITIRHEFRYGDLGLVLKLYGWVYHFEYGFNHEFEAYVAEGLSEFAKDFTNERNRLWIAEKKNKIIGSIAILEKPKNQAQLRWFLLHPDFRGFKIGKDLMIQALLFSQNAGYDKIFLWTLEQLQIAKAIYINHGFRLCDRQERSLWEKELVEEQYVLNLK